jgi:DMSO/TMAO reductase YedYZ molybdopterin-dependent catalytic subunit
MHTRRQFLRKMANAVGFMAAISLPVTSKLTTVWGNMQRIILPKGTKRESLVDENPAHLDARNLEITPLSEFGTMGLTDHAVEVKSWRLEIKGHVKNPLTLAYQQITALPQIERNVLLVCPGFFVNHGHWKGISIKELLKLAQAEEGITRVTIRGPRPPNEHMQAFPIGDVLSDKVFLAYEVNSEPLPEKHGFPLRVVAEGYYGFDWIKYVYSVTAEKS